MKDNITVKIITISKGLEYIENVKAIRIKSDDYNLLIMKDYMPIIGEVNGMIEIETIEKTKVLENIIAYYIHSNNEFELIIKENVWITY